jgi:hypothetical protein
MKESDKQYWFPAKRYGWGWGPPCAWQGWVVMLIWLCLVIAGAILLAKQIGLFVGFIMVMGAILFAICRAKGEPPRWRWGKD